MGTIDWRIHFYLPQNNGTTLSVSEIELHTAVDGADVATDVTKISCSASGREPANLLDGSLSTFFWSVGQDAWVNYSLDDTLSVVEVVVRAENNAHFARAPQYVAVHKRTPSGRFKPLYASSAPLVWYQGEAKTFALKAELTGGRALRAHASRIVHGIASAAPVPAPVADFAFAPSGSGIPIPYQFTNLSANAVSFNWDFGDGGTSTATNPIYGYSASGVYDVTLTATGADGTTSSVTKSITVVIAVVANFSVDVTSGQAPLTVNFQNLSLAAASYSWDFGDTGTSSSTSPSHTYSSAGTYTAVLTASGADGSTDTFQRTITATAIPVVAGFTLDVNNGSTPLTVQTTNTSTGASSYDWNWGDGSAHSTTTSPSHVYSSAGTYTIVLTATGTGGSNTFSRVVTAASPSITLKYSLTDDRANPLDLNAAAFTTARNLYIFVPEQPNITKVEFFLDPAVPSAPTGTPYRTENLAPWDYNGTGTGVALPVSSNSFSNAVHTISARVTFSDTSTAIGYASFNVNIASGTTVPQTIVSPMGFTRSLIFNDEFDAVLDPVDGVPDIDRSKWTLTAYNAGQRGWMGAPNAANPDGYNGYHFWCDRKFNGNGAIASNLVYNPFVFDTPSVLKIRTTKLQGSQFAAYNNWLTSTGKPSAPALFGTGWLSTGAAFFDKHFYMECRCKLPPNKGCWPAFWSLKFTAAGGQGQNPEVDVMEFLGGGTSGAGSATSSRFTTALHIDSVVNLIPWTENLSGAGHTNTSITVGTGTNVNGATTNCSATATAANAQHRTAVTTSAASYTYKVRLKRKTGSGNVQISADGTNWVTQSITSSWAQYSVTQTCAAGTSNPGVRIVTSGDAVYIDQQQMVRTDLNQAYIKVEAPESGGLLYHTGISNLSNGTWHTFGFEWTKTDYVFTFDGAVVHSGKAPLSMDTTRHLILCMQSGGAWWYNDYTNNGGTATSRYDIDAGPYDWEIDYVRVYGPLSTAAPAMWDSGLNIGTHTASSTNTAFDSWRGRPTTATTGNYAQYNLADRAYRSSGVYGMKVWSKDVVPEGYVNLWEELDWFDGILNLQVCPCETIADPIAMFTKTTDGRQIIATTQNQFNTFMTNQANGQYNTEWQNIGKSFATWNRTKDNTVLCLGHEWNGDNGTWWYPWWPGQVGVTVYKNMFRNAVLNFRIGYASISPNTSPPLMAWTFGANKNTGTWDVWNWYPGNDVVDIIGVHHYDFPHWQNTTDWTVLRAWPNTMATAADYCRANNKLLYIGEWNIINAPSITVTDPQRQPAPAQDNATYIQQMFNFLRDNRYQNDGVSPLVLFDSLFQSNGGHSYDTKYLYPENTGSTNLSSKNTAAGDLYQQLWTSL